VTFIYVGPFPAVTIKLPGGRWVDVAQGDELETISDAEADALAAHPHWEATSVPTISDAEAYALAAHPYWEATSVPTITES